MNENDVVSIQAKTSDGLKPRRGSPVAYIDPNGKAVTWQMLKDEVDVGFEYFKSRRLPTKEILAKEVGL